MGELQSSNPGDNDVLHVLGYVIFATNRQKTLTSVLRPEGAVAFVHTVWTAVYTKTVHC